MAQIGATVNGTTQINLTYLPQFLVVDNASTLRTTFGTSITALKVTVLGAGVICDLDQVGLMALKNLQAEAMDVTQTTQGRGVDVLQLADGIIKGVNVVIEITAGAVQPVFGFSVVQGANFLQSIANRVIALSGQTFRGNLVTVIPTFAATDRLNVTYTNGFTENMFPTEVRALNSFFNTFANSTYDAAIKLNNYAGNIQQIDYYPQADRTIYIQNFFPAKSDLSTQLITR